MNPELDIFKNHDLDRIATEAIRQKDTEARISNIKKLLENPDKTEEHNIGTGASREVIIVALDNSLSVYKKLSLCSHGSYPEKAKVELFKPYETVISEEHFGTIFETSLISADLFEAYERDGDVIGKLVLFKLDHSESKMTAKDLVVGVNCVYGALIISDEIKPFRMAMRPYSDRVIQEVQRTDPTEENGVAVDVRLVEKGFEGKRLNLRELDLDKDAIEYQEVMDELDKFIEHRRQSSIDQSA